MSCFIIAEAGVNHNGSIELAKQLIVEAKRTGADAVVVKDIVDVGKYFGLPAKRRD